MKNVYDSRRHIENVCVSGGVSPVNSISDNWNDNLHSLNQEKNEASVPVFYADWTSVPVPQMSSLRGLDVSFMPTELYEITNVI